MSESPSENAMLTPAPRAVARPVKKAVTGSWVARTTAKIGARVESEPSMSPLSAGWTRCRRTLCWIGAAPETSGRATQGCAPV